MPPRVVDQVVVGGGYAASLLTNGSSGSAPKNAFFHHDHSVVVLLKIRGQEGAQGGGNRSWERASSSAPMVSFSMSAIPPIRT